MHKIRRNIPPAPKTQPAEYETPPPTAAEKKAALIERVAYAFFDCRFTRFEVFVSIIAVACTIALQLNPVLSSPLADPLIIFMALVCWTTPVTAFYFIACGQVLPFPETSMFNPAQVGVITWPIVALLYHRKVYYKQWKLLLPLLPFLIWFTLVAESFLDMVSMRSEYVRVVIYSFIACHYAVMANGRYLKCLLGVSFGALSIVATWWAGAAGLPVQLYEYDGNMAREGFERLGSQRADAVMVWPPLLMGTFGVVGVAMTHTFSPMSGGQARKLMTAALVAFVLAIPPLLETMTHAAYGGFIIMSGLVLATMYNNVLSSKIDVKTKSKLMRLVLVPLFGLGLVISTNTFEARSRIEGLWAYYQEELKDQSIVASRTDVWTYSLRTIQQYPLLGVKNSGEKENIPPQYRASGNYVAHNVFLDYGRYSGIPGMLLIAYFFFHPILKLISHRRHQLYYGFYFAYFVMFIFWMTLSFQFYKTFWVLWMLLAVAESNLRILALPRQNAGRAVRPGTHRRARRAPTHPARSAAQSRPSEPKEEPNERTV